MLTDAISSRTPALLEHDVVRRLVPALAVAVAILVLALPMLRAEPAPLTSDESLYLAEGYNIATGAGPRYASGEIVNHRPPLYPALLSLPLRLTGGDPASAYWVPKLIALALIGATFLLGRQLFGTMAGALAALLVSASGFLRWLGTTLFLDGAETLFLLLFMASLWRSFQDGSIRWFALSGVLFGLAFWTKEAAILWLPLPLAFALLSSEHRNRRVAAGLAAYGATAAALLAVWWAWVYAATDRIYFWGPPDARLAIWIGIAVAIAALLGLAWFAVGKRAALRLPLLANGIGLALVLGWAVLFFLFLELGSWPLPKEHWRTVPQYLWQIAAANSQPWPLLALGVLWLLSRADIDRAARFLVLGLVLFLPFALFVANRDFAYRDVLPMLYLAYIGGAGLAVALLRWAAERAGVLMVAGAVVVGLVVFGLVQTDELLNERVPYDRAAVTQTNWDNPMVYAAASWLHENVPPGERIMASRLYFSHLYVLDEGRHPIDQLPTLRIEANGGETPLLTRVTTLFRWEDYRMGPAHEDERWLYVRRNPIKTYYIGLSEWDLLRTIEEREVGYLVITGEDAGFSSFTYLDYFEENPAFTLVYTDRPSSANGVYIYRIDREQLALRDYQAAVSEETLAALANELGLSPEQVAVGIDPDGIVIRPQED